MTTYVGICDTGFINMKCYLLLLNNSPVTSVTGPMEIFALANRWLANSQQIDMKLLSLDGEPIPCLGGLSLSVHGALTSNIAADLIIVGAIGDPAARNDDYPEEILSWLRKQYKKGSKIASICTGAFVLAESGLLDGFPATTHWQSSSLFKHRFPKVLIQPDAIITHHEGLYCSGGASAYQDMCIYLLKTFFGVELAQHCAKSLLFDSDRQGQSQYASFLPYRKHSDELILRIQDWIEKHLVESFTMVNLAEMVHLSERQFKRRFKQATFESPLVYVQSLRIELAKKQLAFSSDSIEVISRSVGYDDVRFFRQLFKRHTSLAPTDYRQKIALRN